MYVHKSGVGLKHPVSACVSDWHWNHSVLFPQASQHITSMSEPPGLDANAHDHPSLNLLPEIQTPPPEEVTATTTPSELQMPSTENTPSQDAPVLSIDTLTPPPEAEPSLSEGLVVKDNGESVLGYFTSLLNRGNWLSEWCALSVHLSV